MKLAYAVLEDETSHNLLFIRWRYRKASGVIQAKYKDLRTRGANGIDFSLGLKAREPEVLRAGEDQCPGLSNKARSTKFFFPLSFCLIWALFNR